MVSKQELTQYRAAQAALEAQVARDLNVLWRAVEDLPLEQMRTVLVNEVPLIINKYGSLGQVMAAEWFEQLIQSTAFVPDLYSPDVWEASTRWAISPLFDEQKTAASALSFLVASSQRHVSNHARWTISENVARSPKVFYARALGGKDPCGFCRVLASRGPVYGKTTVVRDKTGEKYHDDCHCVAVPMRGEWVPDRRAPSGLRWEGDQIAGFDFEKTYLEDYKPFHQSGDKITDVIRKMRAERPGTR